MDITIGSNVNDIVFNGNHVQKLVFNGHKVWSAGSPGPSYTEVSYIKSTSTGYNYNTLYFNTGIYTNATTSYKISMGFMPLVNQGNLMFGHQGNIIGSSVDSADFRLFWYSNSVYVDCGNGRKYTSKSLNDYWQFVWEVDMSTKTYSLKIKGGTNILNNTFSTNPNNQPFYVSLPAIKFKYLKIEKDGNTAFDGKAVIDGSNVPCIYDSVSNTLLYVEGINASKITYES